MSELALFGGTPVISGPLPPYRAMGPAEKAAVAEVMESGCLSGFMGSPGPAFLGGPKVRAFEEAWAKHCGVKHAVSMNSATSGLIAAMGVIELRPGDEVIVPPWTMSATVAAVLVYGGVPVFADIEPITFCIDPNEVAKQITTRTRAIIAVNLFGHPAQLARLRALADERGIYLVEDSAQAPLAFEHGKRAGTVGHIGVFSFNYHKHIHTGEGGMCVTNEDHLAGRMQLVRNHGENLSSDVIGFNFRMTEIAAAIGIVQLAAIEEHVDRRRKIVGALNEAVMDCEDLVAPEVRLGCAHNYYLWALRYWGDAERFSAALAAEGFPHTRGYVKPLHRLHAFRRTRWRQGSYPVPVAEMLDDILLFETCAYDVDDEMTAKLCECLRKVYAHRGEL
jgi:perosamine synthetase